jgi:hypothetical protein
MRVLLRHTHAQAHPRTSGVGLLCLSWHSFTHHPTHLSRAQVTPQRAQFAPSPLGCRSHRSAPSSPHLLSGAGHTAVRPVHLIFSRVQVTPQRAQFTSSSLGCRSHRSAPSSPHPLLGAGHTAVCPTHPFFSRTQRALMLCVGHQTLNRSATFSSLMLQRQSTHAILCRALRQS